MRMLFFICAALLLYVYAGYPLLLLPLVFVRRKRRKIADADLPCLAVLIPARNEGMRILEKAANTLAADYPSDKLEIFVGADACTDNTLSELAKVCDPRLHVAVFEKRVGKCCALSKMAEMARAEILIMSDADVMVEPISFRLLAEHFADPLVGAVCGRRSHHEKSLAGLRAPARLYNLYESAIKRGEGRLHRVLGADGSLYAVRKSFFQAVPANAPDDFVAILRVLAAGARVVYENNAVSRECLASDSAYQFVRKRRTVARGVRGMWLVKSLLNPFRFPLVSFLMLSHKILRWCTPVFLAVLFGLSVILSQDLFFMTALLLQVLFYFSAFAASIAPRLQNVRLFQAARYFVIVNAATALGLWDVLTLRAWSTWETQAESGVD